MAKGFLFQKYLNQQGVKDVYAFTKSKGKITLGKEYQLLVIQKA